MEEKQQVGHKVDAPTQKIALHPNNKQCTLRAQHAGYARVAYTFALSAFKAGLDTGEWRSYMAIKREFNAVT